jgi:hypothetical protein
MSLSQLILAPEASIESIRSHLDALAPDTRIAEVQSLGRAPQKKLWDLAAASPAITLEHFVPAGTPHTTEVIHHGRNTLPVFTHFQKRFALPADGTRRLFGYNEGVTRSIIGPGCFVAIPTDGNPSWQQRGAWVVDYFQVPDGPVPAHWPKVVPNTHGLQFLVYNKTRDFMRRVSTHVSIGEAYKVERSMGSWFVLCRDA